MGIFFNYNGKIYKERDAVIGAANRGLRYGDGLFETMKYKNGALLFAKQHFARLWNGLKILQFEIPKHVTQDFLEKEIVALLNTTEIKHDARIRLNIFRGDGGLYDAKDDVLNYIIEIWELSADSGKWNSNGLVVGIYDEVKKSCDVLSNLKHNNYLPSVIAALYAKKEKWNDALILNSYDRICETTIANIFLIKDEIIYTPPLSEGCVAGIMRAFLIEQLHSLKFIINEKPITLSEVMDADEICLTNSIYNIRWVQQIGNKSFSNTLTQKIYSSIISTIL
jgi:branched-chain amino acid aminotransferase